MAPFATSSRVDPARAVHPVGSATDDAMSTPAPPPLPPPPPSLPLPQLPLQPAAPLPQPLVPPLSPIVVTLPNWRDVVHPWVGSPFGEIRAAQFSFECIGERCRQAPRHGGLRAGRRHAAGTLQQPFRSMPRGPISRPDLGCSWTRMCRACYVSMRARALWDQLRRAYSSYVARELARGLLRAYQRATERVYALGGIGYVRARKDFEMRARVQRPRQS